MNKKIKDIFFILILGSISAFLLLGIKNYTYPKISRYEEINLKRNILEAAGIDYVYENIEKVFEKSVKEIKEREIVYYLSPQKFYIFEFRGRGLWGPIKGIVTVNRDLETIENIKIISQEETPGLGARITEEPFLNQFVRKRVSPKLDIALRRKSFRDNEIDSISGATMTSRALVDMINESVIYFRSFIKDKNAFR